MTWCDLIWHDVKWLDMTWCVIALHGVTWHYIMWHDITWHSMAWHGMTWRGRRGRVVLNRRKKWEESFQNHQIKESPITLHKGRNPPKEVELTLGWVILMRRIWGEFSHWRSNGGSPHKDTQSNWCSTQMPVLDTPTPFPLINPPPYSQYLMLHTNPNNWWSTPHSH